MKRHEIQLRVARMALEVASGKDVLTVASEYDCGEDAVRHACQRYRVEQRLPAVVGRKTKFVVDRPPTLEDLVRIMEQFCNENIGQLGRLDLLQINDLVKRLEQQLIARKQA